MEPCRLRGWQADALCRRKVRGEGADRQVGKKGKTVELFGEGLMISNHRDITVSAILQDLAILSALCDDGIADACGMGA